MKIRISIADQRLDVLESAQILYQFPVSTSQFGPGSEPDSGRTPLGRFAVAEKIGGGEPLGMVFKSRAATGEIAAFSSPGDERDLITTRILWLEGLEPHNANTRGRYIYLHGTNHEELIGRPASHGCVRMRNADIAMLFDITPPGAEVLIEA